MFVPTALFFEELINHITGVDTTTFLGNASICLNAANITPTVNTVFADLTECNYHGYARVAASPWEAVAIDNQGNFYASAAAAFFRPTDSVVPNTAFAGFLMGDASTKLYGVEVFDTPYPLTTPLDLVTYVPRVAADPTGNWGNGVASS